MVTITTAGDDMSELWKDTRAELERILEQYAAEPPDAWFGDEQFAFICELDSDDDVFDEGNWVKANPMLAEPNSPVKLDHLRDLAARAKAGDLSAEQRFRRYHCNQMVSSVYKPIRREVWALGDQPLSDWPPDVYGGIDLGRSDDFAAITCVKLFEAGTADEWLEAKTFAWTCEGRDPELRSVDFQSLIRADNLHVCPGDQVDFSLVRAKIADWSEGLLCRQWAFDPYFATETQQILAGEYGLDMVKFWQTPKNYNEAVKKFISLVSRGRVRHAGCPLLAWQASNLVIRPNSFGHESPDKQAGKYKIDSIVALLMALRLAIEAGRSDDYWEEGDGFL